MTNKSDFDRLGQASMLAWLRRDMPINEMVTVYLSGDSDQHDHGIYCALIPSAAVEESLERPGWDLGHGGGMPGAVEYYDQGNKTVKYCRFGDDRGIEPLVIDRGFHGVREGYKELSEEFRLFHRLYHDQKDSQFIKIDDDGNEHLIATIEPALVKVRLKEIRQFLAIKEMHLAIQFVCQEFSSSTLKELGLTEGGGDHREELTCWALHFGDIAMENRQAFSRLQGKRLIPPLPKEKSGFWGYAEKTPKKHVDFIIGINESGDEISYTSDPDALANNFGANPDAPHYLTPVHFRKTVLEKYYQQPQKYSVEDAYLRRRSLWGMSLDNHHDDKVCAWLGDLGRDLPYEEQLHWRSHNIVPAGGMSKTFVRRQIDAEFTNSDRPEHVFQKRYHDLAKACEEVLGWPLLLPLSIGDQHHFQCLRIPATDEQRDFDEVVLGLTKILIDSLNENALNGLIPVEGREGLKGSISRFEAALSAHGIANAEKHIKFLRGLQDLRSSGSAHRKGSNYRGIAADFGIDSQSLRSVFAGILGKALDLLEFLAAVVRSRRLGATGKT